MRDDVASLLMSPFGQGLAATPPHAVKREWPFTLRIEGEGGLEIFLTGKMDLLIEGHGAEPLRVVDYKHTRREGRTAEDYRFQLMSYALAARTLLGATDIRAEIVFLKDRGQRWDDGPMALTPTAAELDAFEGDLATLGADLIRARLADRFRKSAPDHCRAIHCGYLWRCHPQERGR